MSLFFINQATYLEVSRPFVPSVRCEKIWDFSLKTKLASLNKANLHYLSQTSQNNPSKIFFWKRVTSLILQDAKLAKI